ncbi:hypothetical protein [Aeromonas diversa]|uniref:hypothetical protein n=1 Tax=Aeromonas diversa TaxID=502790 RepID=UPI00346201B4
MSVVAAADKKNQIIWLDDKVLHRPEERVAADFITRFFSAIRLVDFHSVMQGRLQKTGGVAVDVGVMP